MKKYIALLLALVMVLSLAACSVEKAPETTAASVETTPVAEETTPVETTPVASAAGATRRPSTL